LDYSELITIVLSITALLLIRQIVFASRRNSITLGEDDYTGRALDPQALARLDEDSMREFDRLLDSTFTEEE